MRTEKEQKLLLRALDAFQRKIVVISGDFCILASAGVDSLISGESPSGKFCHEVFYNRPEPCDNCPARKVLETGKPSLRDLSSSKLSKQRRSCLYAYPISDDDGREVFTIFNLTPYVPCLS